MRDNLVKGGGPGLKNAKTAPGLHKFSKKSSKFT